MKREVFSYVEAFLNRVVDEPIFTRGIVDLVARAAFDAGLDLRPHLFDDL